MARRAPGLVSWFAFAVLLHTVACSPEPKTMPMLNAVNIRPVWQNGLLMNDGRPLTASIYSLQPNGRDTASIFCFDQGKENGVWRKFYSNGQLEETRQYDHGIKTGDYLAWWPDGKQKLFYHFKNGEFDGVYREWTDSGILIKEMNYLEGHENGSQKQFFNDGTVKANYTIIGGRRYGLLGTKNCVNVSATIFRN